MSFGGALHTSLTPKHISSLVNLAETYSNFTLTTSTGAVASVTEFAENIARSENHKVSNNFNKKNLYCTRRTPKCITSGGPISAA